MHASLRQLKIFLSIAQYKTITAAAEQECLSKPALSIALNELEEQLGYKLFDRVKNRLIMNEIGRRLLPIVDELLLRYDSISPALKDPATGATTAWSFPGLSRCWISGT